jgi:hypothetical protein
VARISRTPKRQTYCSLLNYFFKNNFKSISGTTISLGAFTSPPFAAKLQRQKTTKNLLMALTENAQAIPNVFHGLTSSDIIESYYKLQHVPPDGGS